MTKVLVTGADGYIGASLCPHLVRLGWNVVGAVRSLDSVSMVDGVDYCGTGPIETVENWAPYLRNINIVIHMAGISSFPQKPAAPVITDC